jgi:hypothetical protein
MEKTSEKKINGAIESSATLPETSMHTSLSLLKSNRYTQNDDDNDDEIEDTSSQLVELNNRIKNDFMSYCLSSLQNDQETQQCVQIVWNKYLQCVGDVAMVNSIDRQQLLLSLVFVFAYSYSSYPAFSMHFHIPLKHRFYLNIKMKFYNGVEVFFTFDLIQLSIRHINPSRFQTLYVI